MHNPKIESFSQFAYSCKETVYHSYQSALDCITQGIEGDFVECGVAMGSQILAFQQACFETNVFRNIHAFDSFQGIPLAGPNDTEQPGIGKISHDTSVDPDELLKSSGATSHSLEQVVSNFNRFGLYRENLKFHVGWFEHKIPEISPTIEKISLLRLDGDLYSSTLVSLEGLYDKVTPGGYVIIDDYGLEGCRRAIKNFFESRNENLPELQKVHDDSVFYFRK